MSWGVSDYMYFNFIEMWIQCEEFGENKRELKAT